MHPDSRFAMTAAEAQGFAREIAFAHIFVAGAVAVIHAPVLLLDDGDLEFHVARRNRAMPLAAGDTAIASIGGPGDYVSPDWYESADQVPTWNYVAVEAEGSLATMDRDALVAHLDAASRAHETRLAPKLPWTRAKMDAARFEAMVDAIAGFTLRVAAWRGTAKLSQNKPAADVYGVIAGLTGAGKADAADLARTANRARL